MIESIGFGVLACVYLLVVGGGCKQNDLGWKVAKRLNVEDVQVLKMS